MSRLFVLALVLAEINFRCTPSSACADDDAEDRCAEGETGETEGETEGEMPVDLGA